LITALAEKMAMAVSHLKVMLAFSDVAQGASKWWLKSSFSVLVQPSCGSDDWE
jgi:hypothetical protein